MRVTSIPIYHPFTIDGNNCLNYFYKSLLVFYSKARLNDTNTIETPSTLKMNQCKDKKRTLYNVFWLFNLWTVVLLRIETFRLLAVDAKQFIYLKVSSPLSSDTVQSSLIFNFRVCCRCSLTPLVYVNLKVRHSHAFRHTCSQRTEQMKILFWNNSYNRGAF